MRLVLFSLFATAALFAAGVPYHVESNVVYSTPGGESLKLDAHIPEGKGPFPAVILVHGGSWTAGHKTVNFILPLFPVLDQTGMAWFSIDYRLAPKYPYPAAKQDVEAAIDFVKKHARQYHVNPRKIVLMGESAGAYLVNVIGAKNDAGVAGVVCFYGPIDMEVWGERYVGKKPITDGMKAFFQVDEYNDAARAKMHEASPRTYLNKKTPPFLVIHGTRDTAVSYEEQALLHVKLFREKGIPVELITVQDGIHGVMNWEKEERFQNYKEPMKDWLRKTVQ